MKFFIHLLVLGSMLLSCQRPSISRESSQSGPESVPAEHAASPPNHQLLVQQFINRVSSDNRLALSQAVHYPLKRQHPLPHIRNQQEFLERYEEVFSPQLVQLISQSSAQADWSVMGARGIMLKAGLVWLSESGELRAINYESDREKAQRKVLTDKEQTKLHSSVSHFARPLHQLHTAKFIFRIDEVAPGEYRYAAWSKPKGLDQKPDIVIAGGQRINDGSGGNHRYEFKNGQYTYVCSIIRIGEEPSAPARLEVFKQQEPLLSEAAYLWAPAE